MKASRRRLYPKTIALAVCLLFITLSVYGYVQATERNSPDPDLKNFLNKPIHLISSLFGAAANPGKESDSTSAYDLNSKHKTKITHNLKCDKINEED